MSPRRRRVQNTPSHAPNVAPLTKIYCFASLVLDIFKSDPAALNMSRVIMCLLACFARRATLDNLTNQEGADGG